MPQLTQFMTVYQSQWFWLLLVLGAIYLLAGHGIVPKVEATVDARDAQIAADLAEAERLSAAAEEAEETWRKRHDDAHADAHHRTAEAKTQVLREGEQRIAAADAEIATKVEAAAAALATARQGALAEIETVAAEAARAIVAKLTGAAVPDEAARRAAAGALSRA